MRPIKRTRLVFLSALATLIALAAILMSGPLAAHADDEPGGDQEKTSFYFGGFINYQDKPLKDVAISIEGGGFDGKTKTNADGAWRLYVPDKDKEYTLTIDEKTLPEGVIVSGDSASQKVKLGVVPFKIINLFLGEGERQVESFGSQLLGRFVSGISFGLLLALASMGAALIYGTTSLSNFAHGEMVTWGGFLAFIASTMWNLPIWLGITAAILGGVALGYVLDAGLWRPLRKRGLGIVQVMIVSIGLSLALRFAMQFFIGGSTHQLPGASPQPLEFGPIKISPIDLLSMGISLVAIFAVAFFLSGTRLGKATRAISDNPQLASATGINVDRVIRIVWMIAGGLAALAGVLWAYYRPGVKWDMGTSMLLLIFAAITLGGLGSAYGALLGSLIVGIVVEMSTLWIPSDLKYAGALVVLVVILLVRPRGLLGRKERLG